MQTAGAVTAIRHSPIAKNFLIIALPTRLLVTVPHYPAGVKLLRAQLPFGLTLQRINGPTALN